jgi:hypothetical protein
LLLRAPHTRARRQLEHISNNFSVASKFLRKRREFYLASLQLQEFLTFSPAKSPPAISLPGISFGKSHRLSRSNPSKGWLVRARMRIGWRAPHLSLAGMSLIIAGTERPRDNGRASVARRDHGE